MSNLSACDVIEASIGEMLYQNSKNIFRTSHSKENPYTLITNKLLRDTTIRHSDRGLMAQLLSWSDYHNLCIKALVKRSVEGRDAIRAMIDRLITAGYIKMNQIKSNDGRFDRVVYQIYEESTGVVVSELDLDGIVDDQENLQMDLFISEISENVNQSENGKPENGKGEPNNNYLLRNTSLNNNMQNPEPENEEKKETKETLLNKWKVDIEDPMLKARLGMAGLSTFVTTQEDLNRFLIDFNQQHEKYKHLNETQRLKNFTAYLVRIKYTPVEYMKHLARLRALGFNVQMPKKQVKENPKVLAKQHAVNPFEETKEAPFEIPNLDLDGF